MTQFLHGIGYAILWIMGMFIIPVIVTLLSGWITDFDETTSYVTFIVIFTFYWIFSAIYLTSL